MSTKHPGLGVMIQMLGGNKETVDTLKAALGKEIVELSLVDDSLRVVFADKTGISILDDGQSCCEHRYMHTDDELAYFVGGTLDKIEIKDGPNVEDDEYGDVKECQFLVVTTSKGQFTCANYNEHNGYYGGFWIAIKPIHQKASS